MTTGSSSPRSPEYAISALDLPTGETTTGTGTHTVRPPGAEPDAREADFGGAAFDGTRPVEAGLDAGLPELDPDLDEPGPEAPGRRRTAASRGDASRAYGDPVGDLVRAAVADRPLEEVVDLITTLEQSPQYAQATVDALRAVGVTRSVEDVTRLVGLLTRPPRSRDSADEAIRAAAEGRSVEDVTRLMALLHRTPLEPHCGRAAVRAAATGRPVEELVELIGRLAESGHGRRDREPFAADEDEGDAPESARPERAAAADRGRRRTPRPARRDREPARTRLTRDRDRGADRDRNRNRNRGRERERDRRERDRDRAARGTARGPAWPAWLTVAVLAGCGVAFFPLHRADAPAPAYGVALGLTALCLLLALLLTLRPAVPLLAVAVVGPAALAAAKLYGDAIPSARLSHVTDLTLAPSWAAVAVAVAAALVALTALCVRVASAQPAPARRRPPRPMTAASGTAD